MWRRREEFEALGTDVLLVSFEAIERVMWYASGVEFGWPILSDPGRAAYRAYGLERASFARAWLAPRTVAFYVRSALRGRALRPPAADARQLGGDFIVDRAGVLRYAFRSDEPADRPGVDELLAVARSLD